MLETTYPTDPVDHTHSITNIISLLLETVIPSYTVSSAVPQWLRSCESSRYTESRVIIITTIIIIIIIIIMLVTITSHRSLKHDNS